MEEKKDLDPTEMNVVDVMDLHVKDLIMMILEEKGTFADFTFRDHTNDKPLAFIAIGLFETAEKLREVFYDAVDQLNIEVHESFESTVKAANDEQV